MNTVTFYSHSQLNSETQPWKEKGVDCRVFSNLWSASIFIDNEEYASTETYFQQFKYSPGDQLFIRNLTSMSEVASYGQRRLVLRLKHIDLIDSLRTKGLPVPLNPQGNPYKLKDKASPVLLIEDWDTVKVSRSWRRNWGTTSNRIAQHRFLSCTLPFELNLLNMNLWRRIFSTQRSTGWSNIPKTIGNGEMGWMEKGRIT